MFKKKGEEDQPKVAPDECIKAFQYRIYPNKEQISLLYKVLMYCRWLYNACLQQRIWAYKGCGKSVSMMEQKAELPDIKREFPEYKDVHSQVLQDIVIRLDKAFKGFFRRIKNGEEPGFPRFKGANRFHSFTYPQSGFEIKRNGRNGRVYLSGIGVVKIRLHREVKGKMKSCTVTEKAGKWYVSFSCIVKKNVLPETEKKVGIDLGILTLAATSDGEEIKSPKAYKKTEKDIAKKQRVVSRRKKGSKRRKKAVRLLQKAHEKAKNVRKHYNHRLARHIVNEYDVIVMEDLQILNMVKNDKLAKSILDMGWGQVQALIIAKAEEAGRMVIVVPPHGTSQTCSGCGEVVQKTLAVRTHKCPHCGLVLDRDVNAAINILAKGLSLVA